MLFFYLVLAICISSFNISNSLYASTLERYEVLNKHFTPQNNRANLIKKDISKKFSTDSKKLSMSKINKYQFRRSDHHKKQIIHLCVNKK